MTWVQFAIASAVIVVAGVQLARYGDVIGDKSGNLFNLLVLGLDDVFHSAGPLLTAVDSGHLIAVLAVVLMNGLFLIGLTQQVLTKRFRVAWDTGAMAVVYAGAVWLVYLMRA